MSNPLEEYFYQNRKNIIHKWPHYFDVYHRHFSRFIDTECVVVEIGVAQGGSLKMWKHYFGSKAKIIGLDINPECKQFEEENIQIFIGSQSDRAFLKDLKLKIPKIDILIDDGGHTMNQQITAFEELFDHVSDNGIYLCEDIHTSYLEAYGGGFGKTNTFLEYSKLLIDKLHAWHIPDNRLPVTQFTRQSDSIHFYDGIVVIEKKARVQPWSEMRGEGLPQFGPKFDPQTVERFRLMLSLLGVSIPKSADIGHLMTNPGQLRALLGEQFDGRIWPKNGETMIGVKRLQNLEDAIKEIIQKNVPGDLIETGVWRGGACIFMRAILKDLGVNNKIVWLADSFQGLPEPDATQYPADSDDDLHSFSELAVSEDEVLNNFRKYDLLDSQVKTIKGWFKDTMPKIDIEQFSLLRLDGDMYESTIDVLFYLYPKLSTGGYCIIDDYGAIPACKKAVEDYRRVMGIEDEIQQIDWTGIFWKKKKNVTLISREDFDDLLL